MTTASGPKHVKPLAPADVLIEGMLKCKETTSSTLSTTSLSTTSAELARFTLDDS